MCLPKQLNIIFLLIIEFGKHRPKVLLEEVAEPLVVDCEFRAILNLNQLKE